MTNRMSIRAFSSICKSLGSVFGDEVKSIATIDGDFIVFPKYEYEEIRIKHLPNAPDLATQAKSLLSASSAWAKSGFNTATETELQSRMEICKECDFWNPKGFRGTGSCQKCSCSTQAKLRMSTSKCPIDKW